MWEWLEDTIDSIGDGIDDAVNWVNDQVDTYIYDSTEEQGVLEKLFSDGVDKYIYDADDDVAWLEGLFTLAVDDKDKEVREPIDDAYVDIDDGYRDDKEDVDKDNQDIWDAILDYLKGTGDRISTNTTKALGLIPDQFEWLLAPVLKIIELLTRSSTINTETFIEDGLIIYRLQKELALRIVELEKEVEQS